ncbi:MAG: hypothetical protein M0R51_14710 [Clostridia bacterium]|jgi:hypothetical protein|nr:hypothetical protein [Clostridia bacterium]
MSVNKAEIKCYEYICLLRDIEKFPHGLYGLDEMRTELHDEICSLMNIEKSRTKKITDNLDKFDYSGTSMYLALLEEIKKDTVTTK